MKPEVHQIQCRYARLGQVGSGGVRSVMGNWVLCGAALSFSNHINCYVKIFSINNSCDWRRTMPHHIITITNLTDPTQSNLEYICTVLNLDQNLSSHIQNPKFLSYVNSWFFKKEYNSIPLKGNNSLAGRQSLRWCWRRWCVCPPSVTMYNKTWSRLLIERSQCWITRVRLGVEARRSARREMRW